MSKRPRKTHVLGRALPELVIRSDIWKKVLPGGSPRRMPIMMRASVILVFLAFFLGLTACARRARTATPASHSVTVVDDDQPPEDDHPHGGPPGQTGEHPHGGPPGQTGEHPQGGPSGQASDEPDADRGRGQGRGNDANRGHGNDADGDDEDNPGQGRGRGR